MLILCLPRLSLFCGSKQITNLLFSSASQASAVMVRGHFTTVGFHKRCSTITSDSHIIVASQTQLQTDSENDDTLSNGSSELSDFGIWSPVQEAETTVTNAEITFGKDSQDWFTALVLAFISIGRKANAWDESLANLGCVPLPLLAHAGCITVGRNNYLLQELVDALQSDMKFPLGTSVKCTLRDQQVALGDICALLSIFLTKFVESALGVFPDITEPQYVDIHVWRYLFAMLAYCNEIASLENSFFRILPQYWPLSHGYQILRSIKLEFQCGDLRKYAGKRKTRGQFHLQSLNGRRSRGLRQTG